MNIVSWATRTLLPTPRAALSGSSAMSGGWRNREKRYDDARGKPHEKTREDKRITRFKGQAKASWEKSFNRSTTRDICRTAGTTTRRIGRAIFARHRLFVNTTYRKSGSPGKLLPSAARYYQGHAGDSVMTHLMKSGQMATVPQFEYCSSWHFYSRRNEESPGRPGALRSQNHEGLISLLGVHDTTWLRC